MARRLSRWRDGGITHTVWGDAAHPVSDPGDPAMPSVLWWRGSAGPALATAPIPRVALVGTRRCSRYGYDLAVRLGAELASLGCVVVSGLAAGIDAAAHRGALAATGAPTLAVVGTGVNVTYPARSRAEWAGVVERGVICSEFPPGTGAAPWRFPRRNRTMVALSDVIVVVESHDRGGALITARYAAERGVPVLAVPGSVNSAASKGCNRLLVDGCAPCLDVGDIVGALGLLGRDPSVSDPRCSQPAAVTDGGDRENLVPGLVTPVHEAPRLDPLQMRVLQLVGSDALSTERVVDGCADAPMAEVLVAVARLVSTGHLVDDGALLSCGPHGK
ncbi:MAG: DNA-processing protein DprA [Microthrixaceae bacterium]